MKILTDKPVYAKNDWLLAGRSYKKLKVADHLFEKKDFSYSLFFGHLAVEKMIKAIYVKKKDEHAPHIHNLVRLAEQADIALSTELKETLIMITAFNLESRYPDEKRSFRSKCTEPYTSIELGKN